MILALPFFGVGALNLTLVVAVVASILAVGMSHTMGLMAVVCRHGWAVRRLAVE